MSNNIETKEPRELLDMIVKKFHDAIEEDEGLRRDLKGYEKDITIDFTDAESYYFSLRETDIGEIKEGNAEDSDITIHTDVETLQKLIESRMKPMEAYARKKIKVDASFSDLLKLKDLL